MIHIKLYQIYTQEDTFDLILRNYPYSIHWQLIKIRNILATVYFIYLLFNVFIVSSPINRCIFLFHSFTFEFT